MFSLKKPLCYGLILVLAVSMIACTSREPKETSTAAPGTETAKTAETGSSAVQPTEKYFPLQKQVEISYMLEQHPSYPANSDMLVIKELEKRTNIKIKLEGVMTNFKDKLNLSIASGDMPDVIVLSSVRDVQKTALNGPFMPLNKLISSNAPNMQQRFKQFPGLKSAIEASDGEIYCAPTIETTGKPSGWMLRTDWLKKVGMDFPKTYDDLYNVAKAFTNNDPDGNGKNDTIGIAMIQDVTSFDTLFNSFGALNGFYPTRDKSKFVYGYTMDEMKDALKFIKKLYSEGVMDKEWPTTTKKQWEEKISSGVAGMTHMNLGRTETFTAILQKSNKDVQFLPFLPAGPGGKKEVTPPGGMGGTADLNRGTVITRSCKNPEVAMRFLDYIQGEDGALLTSYGVENVTYRMVNGGPEYTDAILKHRLGVVEGLEGYGLTPRVFPCMPYNYPKVDLNQKRYGGTLIMESFNMCKDYYLHPKPVMAYKDDEMKVLNKEVNVSDATQKWIFRFVTGQKDIDKDWEEYKAELKSAGMEEVLAAYNKAYSRYLETMKNAK